MIWTILLIFMIIIKVVGFVLEKPAKKPAVPQSASSRREGQQTMRQVQPQQVQPQPVRQEVRPQSQGQQAQQWQQVQQAQQQAQGQHDVQQQVQQAQQAQQQTRQRIQPSLRSQTKPRPNTSCKESDGSAVINKIDPKKLVIYSEIMRPKFQE